MIVPIYALIFNDLYAREVVSEASSRLFEQLALLLNFSFKVGDLLESVCVSLALGHRVSVQAETLGNSLHFLSQVFALGEHEYVGGIGYCLD